MFELVFGAIIILLVIALVFALYFLFSINSKYSKLAFLKSSQSVKYGQLTEQWIPFSSKFPYTSQNFRFIGKPIDGISFEEDKIVFVEFKTNKSQLNESQRRVRELVDKKKVEWFELRVD